MRTSHRSSATPRTGVPSPGPKAPARTLEHRPFPTLPLLLSMAVGMAVGLGACGADDVDHDAHEDMDQPALDQEAALREVHDHGDGTVQVAGDLARRLGVALSVAEVRDLERVVRTTGEIVPDETRLSTVSLRFGGWAERLHVDFTGRFVNAGEPLMEVYSPELVSAQEDLISARRLADELAASRVPGSRERSDGIVTSARERLRFWQVPEAEIRRVEETGQVRERMPLESPSTGFVLEKGVVAGERFEAGTPLFRLADLSRVWLEAEVYERDVRWVRLGTQVRIQLPGQGLVERTGRVTFIDPQVDRDRRTVRVRVELPNPGGDLRPGMYATAEVQVVVAQNVVTVPRDAVLHTGRRAVVFVALGGDRYEGREVQLGAETDEQVEIRSGLEAGERVVSRAGFVLDSESRLMEAMMRQPGMPGMDVPGMDMPGMEMDMEMPGMDMPGMEMDMEMPGMAPDTPRMEMDMPGMEPDTARRGPGEHDHTGGPHA
jgi:RND family efflux transporter MFP subunit